MTTDGWEQVLDTYQAQIYELCNRTVAYARLHDAAIDAARRH